MLRNVIQMGGGQNHLPFRPLRRLAVHFHTAPWSWMGPMKTTFPFAFTAIARPFTDRRTDLLPIGRITLQSRFRPFGGHFLLRLPRPAHQTAPGMAFPATQAHFDPFPWSI